MLAYFKCILKLFENAGSAISGAMVGLAVSQAIGLTGMVQYGMTQIAEVVNQMTSVERILQYTILEQEGPFDTPKGTKTFFPARSNRLNIYNLYSQEINQTQTGQ